MNKFLRKISGSLVVLGAVFVMSACSDSADSLELFLGAEPDSLAGFTSFAPPNQDALANQLALPQAGEYYAVVHTNHGEIHIRLFPEHAPLAVRNFVTHAQNGYYDGVIFHRVIHDFMIQSGDPLGTGRGGESIWGQGFGSELSSNLQHIRGALSMANTGAPNSNSSQFFIVRNYELNQNQTDELTFILENLLGASAGESPHDGSPVLYRDIMPEDFLRHYLQYGGAPFLDFRHTVFGQVFYGMDVVDSIAVVEVIDPYGNPPLVPPNHQPVVDVVIERIEIRAWEQ
ncbi:MAG: peptidylprolyl isomerase [Defluviitaleaceae bacterium]|nr:peptidylprolyl isomerase [Defluviitaleaceae bacterium]